VPYIAFALYVWLPELLVMLMKGMQLTLLDNQKDHKLPGWLQREVMLLRLVSGNQHQTEGRKVFPQYCYVVYSCKPIELRVEICPTVLHVVQHTNVTSF